MSNTNKPWRTLLAIGVLCGALAACSDDGDKASTTTPDTADISAPATEPVTTDTPAEELPVVMWETITAPEDCMCGDGSEFSYFVRKADPTKVLFFLEGGGACFTKETCGEGSETYKRTVGYDGGMTDGEGIFDFANPANPFANYSVVFVPYCTGDVHIGNATTDYGDGVVVHHNGYVNGTTALATMAEMFPDATQVVVAGESAGSIPSPLYAGLAHDLLPAARLTVLADGSGAYPDVPAVNTLIGAQWGTMNAVPAWPENEGLTAEDWSLPGLFVQAGKHAPEITFGRHDYAFDETQTSFTALAGLSADALDQLIDLNEEQIEASGIELYSFISPGDQHTVLHTDRFYTETLNGVMLVDWVWSLISGEPIADEHCTDCKTA